MSISLELRAINIKSRVTIFQAMEMVGIQLLHGHSTQQILCPFHDDSKPSARAYSDTNKLFCFTCHKIWDQVSLVIEAKKVLFPQAIDDLEKYFKLDNPAENLPLTVGYNVNKEPDKTPSVSYLLSYVESQIIESKTQLGLPKYSGLLTILDYATFYYHSKKMSASDYQQTLKSLVIKLHSFV